MRRALFYLIFCITTISFAQKQIKRGELIPLVSGEISPEGWLKTMAEFAIDGYTGNMEQINSNAKPKLPIKGWARVKKKATRWAALEQEGYYLDGAIRLGYILNNQKLIDKIKHTIDKVVNGQQKDGYFFDPKLKSKLLTKDLVQGLMNPIFTTEDDGEEGNAKANKKENQLTYERLLPDETSRYLWSIAVFNRAVLALYDASKDQKYLDFLVKFYHLFATSYKREIPHNQPISGTELHFLRHLVNLEVLFETADRAGDHELRKKGLHILKQNESGMVKTWLKKDFNNTRVCHGVTFNELFKLYATPLSKSNPEYLQATLNAYDFLTTEHLQPYGVNSSNEYLFGKGGFKSTELCDIVDFSWSLTWLTRATGSAKFGDNLEKAFFNAFPASIDHYKKHIYAFGPNRFPGISCSNHRTSKHNFKPVWSPQCCTGNLNRALPNFVMHMAMKTQDKGLALLLYGPNTINTKINNVAISINTKTDYPFKEDLVFTVNPEKTINFPIYLRIPEWCKTPNIHVNGKQITTKTDSLGFVKLEKKWQQGDVIKLHLPMSVNVHSPKASQIVDNNNKHIYYGPGASRITSKGKIKEGIPFRYITRGPLLFSLAFDYKANDKITTDGFEYNYALASSIKKDDIIIKEQDVKDWVWDLNNIPISIEVPAYTIDWSITEPVGTMPKKLFNLKPENKKRIQLVPFGCAKYRLTAFPSGK